MQYMKIGKKKFSQPPWITLLINYFVWLAFATILFILTNAFSALDFINANRFEFLDVILTFGLPLFLGMLEMGLVALILVCLHLGIQKYFHVDPSAVIRLFILAWFALSWLNLLLAFFHRSLF
jgi:hypothetical protein